MYIFDIFIIFLLLLITLEHFYFLVLEMFFWTSPKVMKIFGIKSKELAEDSKVLAANLGLYNGFLGTGLGLLLVAILSNKSYNPLYGITIFLLSCVVIAGIYGAYSTKNIRIFYIQAIPALLTLVIIHALMIFQVH